MSGPREVRLVMTPSAFWLRLRLNMQLLVGRLAWLVAAGFVLPTLMLLVTFMGDGWPFELGRVEVFMLAVGASIGLILGTSLVSTVLRSIFPPDHERFLPQAVTFRPDSVRVEPRGGAPFEDSYGFVLGATRTALGLDLKIGQKPLLVLHITPRMIGAEPFGLMELWLVRHGKLTT
jgi:hypothetical protein